MTTKPIRPYARLLTMLGDQLIKNETIALIELIKNCYDADATAVKVTFENFGENFQTSENSRIIIDDNGCGMSEETILKHFLNPATPEKKYRKKKKEQTPRRRIMQGEKGIGRFASLKLGKKITVITKTRESTKEYIVTLDLSGHDEDFSGKHGDKPLFLDELAFSVVSRMPTDLFNKALLKKARTNSGTRIEIECIKGSETRGGTWNKEKIGKVVDAVQRLTTPPFFAADKDRQDFEVRFCINAEPIPDSDPKQEHLRAIFENKRLFHIEGRFDSEKNGFAFSLTSSISGRPEIENRTVSLGDEVVKKLTSYKKKFSEGIDRPFECGSFGFCFYVFDFSRQNQTLPKYSLDDEERKKIRKHRVYLYRDGIRVYPYGDPEDDWLGIDVLRGTIKAGENLSNDQIVGYVTITQRNNPLLQDKTNREGLLESGNATEDFIWLIQIFLGYIRRMDYQQFRANYDKKQENIKANDIYNLKKVENSLLIAEKAIEEGKSNAADLVRTANAEYKKERAYMERRVKITEHLAGVGLSVESASHDIMSMINKALLLNDDLIQETREEPVNIDFAHTSLTTLRGMLSFIESALKNIQQIFRSSKQRRKNIRVNDSLKNVHRIFKNLLDRQKITLNVREIGSPLIVKTTDAVLLQVLINLFDNAIYWVDNLQQSRKIEIRLDGDRQELTFSDNGVGVHEEDVPYIFEPFYSGKGEEGRGLGLYIARQLLEKDDFSIHLIVKKSEKCLSGANFVVRFYPEEE